MKCAIVGSRTFPDPYHDIWDEGDDRINRNLVQFLDVFIKMLYATRPEAPDITEVVCGEAMGMDRIGRLWAESKSIPVKSFPPDYMTYGGPVAPLIRNEEMAKYCDFGLVIWDGKSRGTSHMMEMLDKHGKMYYVLKWDGIIKF